MFCKLIDWWIWCKLTGSQFQNSNNIVSHKLTLRLMLIDWYQSTHRSYCQPKVNSQKSVNVDFDWYKSTHRSYCQPKVNFQKWFEDSLWLPPLREWCKVSSNCKDLFPYDMFMRIYAQICAYAQIFTFLCAYAWDFLKFYFRQMMDIYVYTYISGSWN